MRVEDAVERITEILSGDAASGVGGAEKSVFVEPYIVAEGKGVGQSVVADVPTFGDAGFDVEVAIEPYEAVVELAGGPNECLIFGKSGIEGADACRFVIAENGFAIGRVVMTTCSHGKAERKEDKCGFFHKT